MMCSSHVHVLCKVLQEDEVCVVRVIESLLQSKQNLDSLKTTTFAKLPDVKKVLNRIKKEEGIVTYQQAEITNYDNAITEYMEG